MSTSRRIWLAISVAIGLAAPTMAQSPTPYQPVEQYIGDMNPLSTSLRRLHLGIARPTGFQDVFHVPGEPGKLMRVHGGVQAVFPHSLYAFNDDEEIEAVIPPNTVFRIGPRAMTSEHGMMSGSYPIVPAQDRFGDSGLGVNHGSGRGETSRIIPEGFGQAAALPRPRQRSLLASRPASLVQRAMENDEDDPILETISAPGTIFGDETYRRQRLEELMRQASAAE